MNIIGIHKNEDIILKHGLYGPYLSYQNKNYSIPKWGQANLDELNLHQAISIIEWKKSHPNKNNLEIK